MKKFTKLFLSCAAVAAVTAMVATSAMAANDLTCGYELASGDTPTTGTLTITLPSSYTDADKTLIVAHKTVTDITSIDGTEKTIMQIDQYAANDITGDKVEVTLPALKEGTDDGTYYVFMGGTNGGDLHIGNFKIGTQATYLVGDANSSGGVTIADASAIASHVAELNLITDETALLAADANLSGGVTIADASAIASWVAELVDLDASPIGKAPGAAASN